MKYLLVSLVFATICNITACKKENISTTIITTNLLSSTATTGTWKVASFTDDGTDETSSYSSYRFVFNSTGTVTATASGSSIAGTWQAVSDSGKTKLILDFTGTSSFDSISEDWVVLELSSTLIRLQHVSGGGGGTDTLVFQKV